MNKDLYRNWALTQDNLPIFMQPWWMDAVCVGKEWDVILVEDEQHTIQAAMPYLLRQRLGVRYIIQPQQTFVEGIYVSPTATMDEETIAQSVTQQLQNLRLAYYGQKYAIGSPMPQVMQALGFKLREHVTYRIEDLTNLDSVIDHFSKNKKRQLLKAASLHVASDMTSEQFYAFHTHCLQQQKKKITYLREFLLVLERKCKRANQSQILVIRDADNRPHAAAFVVWDKHSLYFLIPCHDPNYNDSGAGALLALEAMKLARTQGVAFDFEGSMIKGVANHYKQFGTTKTPYYYVERYYHWWFHLAIWWNLLFHRI